MDSSRWTARTAVGAAICAALIGAGTSFADAPPGQSQGSIITGHSHARGRLISATRLGSWSAHRAAAYLDRAGFDRTRVRYGVEVYRVLYSTVDTDDNSTVASGLVVLPKNSMHRLRVVSFAHGTETYRAEAPSTLANDFTVAPGIAYASAGFASVSLDYLGLGSGTGAPPYMDVRSETTASVDLLRAARTLSLQNGRILDRRVFITGFSQGASAALGLARALQNGADPTFRPAAVAPISGAYDIRRAELPAMFAGELDPRISVVYVAYLLVSWNRLHHLYATPAEVFQAPYARKVERFFDGSTPGDTMLAAMPDTIDALLTPRGLDLLTHPRGAMAAALQNADGVCSNWIPRAPIRLYYTGSDEQVATSNTLHCRNRFLDNGFVAPMVELPPGRYLGSAHLGSAVTGTKAALEWFLRLR